MDQPKEPTEDPKEDQETGQFSPDLWKKRYETSCQFFKQSKNKERMENVIKYLHNDWTFIQDATTAPFLNQFAISIKTLIPMVVAHNPTVIVNAENDIVYEYDEMGQPIMDPMTGEPITHDITKVAATIQALLKKRLNKKVDFKNEIRKFLRDAIVFNRGIFLVGHTANTEYSNAFTDPTFHAFIKSIPPHKIKRQAGTKRIDEGTYCFYEYELPLSHLKGNKSYDQEKIKQCKKALLEGIKIDDQTQFHKDDLSGIYDDVQYVKLHNGYDLLTGKIYVFGDGVDEPLKVIEPEYSFKNPFVEFVPNELFQPEQTEPVSDLMMGEHLVKNAQVIADKAIQYVKNYGNGYDVEASAMVDKAQRKRIMKGDTRAIWVWANNALSGNKVRPRPDIPLGPEPINMVEYLFGYFQKILAVYDFQQGGGAGQDETATKTQAKLQTSNFKGGDMSEMFSDACNKGLEKYLEILIKTTDVKEAVKVIGDAGETEYRKFDRDEASIGQYYCEVDLQSMGKANEDVKVQQMLKLYEIVKTDPDPQIQQRVDKVELFTIIAKGLGAGNSGVLRKVPDTRGMDEQAFRDYLKTQMIKAKQETEQAIAGANILPPAPDDDPEIHLAEHLGKAQELKMQAANSTDPMMQQQVQAKIGILVQHAQIHIEAKKEKELLEQRMGGSQMPMMPQMPPPQGQSVDVPAQPPMAGQLAGQAQRTLQ